MAGVDVGELRRVPAFTDAPEAALEALAAEARVVELAAGDILLEHGAVSDEVHAVFVGELSVRVPSEAGDHRSVARFGPGELVGEIAALTGGARTADVVAASSARVARLPAAAFAALLDDVPSVGRALAATARARLRHTRLIELLDQHFPELPDDAIASLDDAIEWVALPGGERLFAEGDVADAAYLMVSGRLHVLRPADQDDHDGLVVGDDVLAEVGRGEIVGEQALIDGGHRTATVVAARDAELARIPRAAFEALTSRHPPAAFRVAKVALERVRQPVPITSTTERTVTLIAAHDSVDLERLADALTREMARHRRVTRVGRRQAETTLGHPGIADGSDDEPGGLRLGRWLEELEDRDDVVLLVCDVGSTPTAWTRRAVRMAEHLVVVADVRRGPEPSPVETWLASADGVPHRPRRSLVLQHPPEVSLPQGTAAWLDVRQVDRHHHVRGGNDDDLRRLGRHLVGSAVGVALSGGGARGYGHVGAIAALREHDVPIDVIAGSSMGCAIAMIAATDPADQAAFATAVEDAFRDVLDYTLPIVAMTKGKRIAAAVERQVGERTLEDMPIPVLGISTDLTRSAVAVHRRGDARTVVRASVAIPGVIPPVVIGDSLHVDAGVMNNLPIAQARHEVRTGTVIAVDVAPPSGPSVREDFGLAVSGWRQLFDRVTPGRRPVKAPTLSVTAMRAMLASATRERQRALDAGVCDLYLQLGRLPCGLLEFDATDRVVAAGYEAAVDTVAAYVDAHPLVRAHGDPPSERVPAPAGT